MNSHASTRLMSIGEFAAATQLSPKALRLYDEQSLLQPARIDSASGYRYYRSDQVTLGRLIRTLRDMDLSLAEVAQVVSIKDMQAEVLLAQLAREVDHRYARQKRAFQAALLLLRGSPRSDAPAVAERTRPAMTVAVHPFMADRRHFFERLRTELDAARTVLKQTDVEAASEVYCRLIDPLSDEEAQVEILMLVQAPALIPRNVTLRQLPPAQYAAIATDTLTTRGADFSAALDALFDWFDRRGHRAIDTPWLRVTQGAPSEILWAHEPGSPTSR